MIHAIYSQYTGPHGVVVERPLAVREVGGSIPGRVKPKTLKLVVMASFLGAQDLRDSITTDSAGVGIG